MKIYDISQEVFSAAVFPGDPSPQRETLSSMQNGALYNLTAFSMCAHNGTHIDAPFHFLEEGKTVESLALEQTVGFAYVAAFDGVLTAADAARILAEAQTFCPAAAFRILLKGRAVVSAECAKVFAESGVLLVGNESQTVGPEDSPMEVHRILLEKEVVLLEGVRLDAISPGVYFLCAAPLSLGGSDGAPCRAILMEYSKEKE